MAKVDPPVETRDAADFELRTFVPYRMLIATDQVSRLFELHYRRDFGLSIAESRILNVLKANPQISSRRICEETAMTKSRVSAALARLAAAGLITRDVGDDDKRMLRLELTDTGRELHARVAPAALEIERCLLSGLSPELRGEMIALFRSIEQRARAEIRRLAARPRTRSKSILQTKGPSCRPG